VVEAGFQSFTHGGEDTARAIRRQGVRRGTGGRVTAWLAAHFAFSAVSFTTLRRHRRRDERGDRARVAVGQGCGRKSAGGEKEDRSARGTRNPLRGTSGCSPGSR
jgi:hypothetical protein